MAPFECALTVGTVWQLTHAIALESAGAVAPWFTWARCTPATPVAVATAGGEEAWFRSAPATLTRPVVPWQDEQLVGAVTVDGSVDVGGERRAGDGAGGGGEVRVAGAVAGRAGGVGRVAEASRRVAVAGGAVHRRVGVPGDGGGGGAGERGVAAVAPGRRAGERRTGHRRRRDRAPRGRERAPGDGDRAVGVEACRWPPGSGRGTRCRRGRPNAASASGGAGARRRRGTS